MSSSLADHARRLFIALLIFAVAPMSSTMGQGSHCDPDYVPVIDWPSSCVFELADANDHRGRAAAEKCEAENAVPVLKGTASEYEIIATVIVGLGTHDTVMMPSMAAARIASTDTPESAHKPGFQAPSDLKTTAFTTTFLSVAGVRVQQFAEPFALVATKHGEQAIRNQLASVDRFIAWWSTLADSAPPSDTESPAEVPSGIEAKISELALSEPLDTIEAPREVPVDAIEISKLDLLVGSGPMIVTIQETYLPYDVTRSDLDLWDSYATASEPFCVRDRANSSVDLLELDDSASELALVRSTEVIQWIKETGAEVVKIAKELSRKRIAKANTETQSL